MPLNNDPIRDEDLRVELFRPPNPNGILIDIDQGVRVTHIPTGLTAESRSERSQLRNKAAAVAQLGRLLAGWWIYEDFVTPGAVIHRGHCAHCNHGNGHGRGRNETENTWHGPYETLTAAQAAPIKNRSRLRNCHHCMT